MASSVQHRPTFHLQPHTPTWCNDPNGVHFEPRTGLYHMFYQHNKYSGNWSWDICWGHAISQDMVMWHSLPPAIEPTPGGPDEDGVWSGCAFPTDDGVVALHTACRRRSSIPPNALPPEGHDLGLEVVECQSLAIAKPSEDPFLRQFMKGDKPLLPLPPRNRLTGWRDPFLIGRPDDNVHKQWTIIVGSGFQEAKSGAALVYTSDSPVSGWEYRNELCRGNGSTGSMWECPSFAAVPLHPSFRDHPGQLAKQGQLPQYALVVCPDSPFNPRNTPYYHMGNYDPSKLKFDMDGATGPLPVDLGDHTFYAPNVLTNDPGGRLVMWGWIQETGRYPGKHEYSSCLSIPRMIWRHPTLIGHLWQEPLDVLTRLRRSTWVWQQGEGGSAGSWHTVAPIGLPLPLLRNPGATSDTSSAAKGAAAAQERLPLVPGSSVALPAGAGDAQQLEIEVTFEPPSQMVTKQVVKSGILFRSGPLSSAPSEDEACGRFGAALLYDWRHGRLDMVYSDGKTPLEQLCGMPIAAYKDMNRASHVFVYSKASELGDEVGQDPEVHEVSYLPLHKEATKEHGAAEPGLQRRPIDIRGCHAIGGHLRNTPPGAPQPLHLRIFIDYSLVEIFTSTGEVLTARVYREYDSCKDGQGPGIELAAFGVPSAARDVRVHGMGSIWQEEQALQDLEQQVKSRMQGAKKQRT